eukprot:scaffold27848_cov149-Isochrysis_galbana.AAC.4
MQWLPSDLCADYQLWQQWIDNNMSYLDLGCSTGACAGACDPVQGRGDPVVGAGLHSMGWVSYPHKNMLCPQKRGRARCSGSRNSIFGTT